MSSHLFVQPRKKSPTEVGLCTKVTGWTLEERVATVVSDRSFIVDDGLIKISHLRLNCRHWNISLARVGNTALSLATQGHPAATS